MLELFYVFLCVMIYLSSFLYRRISILASLVVLYVAYVLEVSLPFALGVLALLTLIRLKKTGVREEL
ncbi:hypothetical protein ACH5BF_11935 [Arcobacter sp. YIC-464]|uniref:hypothetical protein n=1 Tax=Arcobacter sp. YIC-464 TaxID=3376631 RepID=UPI003C1B9A21